MASSSGPSPILLDWITDVTGAPVESARRLAAGGRRHGFLVALVTADDPASLYLAVEPDDETSGDRASGLRLEADVFRRLAVDGVPVPTVVAVHPTVDAMLMHVVPGDAAYSRLGEDDQERVAIDFMRCLAAAHAVDPRLDPIDGLDPGGTPRDHLLAFLDRWEKAYREGAHGPEPVVEHGLCWLRTHVPDTDRPLAFVQGDTGPGNFMADGGRVTAIVDWELAHLGDPLEDIGWLSMRCAQEPFPDFPARLAEYAAASATELDLAAIRYYRVLAEWTVALIGHLKSRRGLGDAERGNAFIYEQLHRRLMVEAMIEADGSRPTDVTPLESADTERTWMYDMALDQLRESVLPALDDGLAVRRTKGVARTVRLLREVDRAGRQAEARERMVLSDVLGEECPDLDAARRALAEGIRASTVGPATARHYAWTRVSLDNQLHGPAMGRLRDRHLPPLASEGDAT